MYNFQLKAYKANLLNEFLPTLTNLLEKSDSSSLIRMPAHIKRFTLLKSPHVNKTAREQFEIRIHTGVFNVKSSNTSKKEVGNNIQKVTPPGIGIKRTHKFTL